MLEKLHICVAFITVFEYESASMSEFRMCVCVRVCSVFSTDFGVRVQEHNRIALASSVAQVDRSRSVGIDCRAGFPVLNKQTRTLSHTIDKIACAYIAKRASRVNHSFRNQHIRVRAHIATLFFPFVRSFLPNHCASTE